MATMTDLGLDRLTLDERVALAEEILASVAAEVDAAPITAPQRDELARRLAAHQTDPSAARSWDDVEAELLARIDR